MHRSAWGMGLGLAVAVAPVQQAAAQTAPTPNISASNVNAINLLAPFLSLTSTGVGMDSLKASLATGISRNNNASSQRMNLAISDSEIISWATGFNIAAGSAIPPASVSSYLSTAAQPVGALGPVMGPIYANAAGMSTATGTALPKAAVPSVVTLMTGMQHLTDNDISVAKSYFANGNYNNGSSQNGPAVAPSNAALPTFNGFPNTKSSIYDVAFGVSNSNWQTTPTNPYGQNPYGNSRPYQVATSSYNIINPNLLTSNNTDSSFPSGHTGYAYTSGILIGMMVPELYQSAVARASQYGESRIVLGAHYPTDIIGSRSLVTYDLAQAFSNPAYYGNLPGSATPQTVSQSFATAYAQLRSYIQGQCGQSVAACATSTANTTGNPYVPSKAWADGYRADLTYGLPTLSYSAAPREQAPAGMADASILLATLYGGSSQAAQALLQTVAQAMQADGQTMPQVQGLYAGIQGSLSTNTINQIVVNTQNEAFAAFYGTPLSYWSRINLYDAAGYFDGVTGTLTMASSDVLTRGATVARGGVLAANGQINGTVTVADGGRLGGTGTVGGILAQAGGTVAAGNSIGTLNVAGNVRFQRGSTNEVEINAAGATDLIAATGTASADRANLAIIAASGTYVPGTTYTFMTAQGGVSGQFSNISTNFNFLTPTVSLAGTAATLTLNRNSTPFNNSANTPNQAAAANAAELLPANHPLYTNIVGTLLGQSASPAFEAMSGEIFASTPTVLQSQSILVRDAVGARLQQAAGTPGAGQPATAQLAAGWTPTLWMQGVGTWSDFNGNGNATGFQADLGGVLFGIDMPVGASWTLGLVGGYSQTRYQVSALNSSMSFDTYDIGVYAGGPVGPLNLALGAAYSRNSGTASRTVAFGSFFGTNMSGPDAGLTQVFGEVSANFAVSPVTVSPFLGLAYVHLNMDAVSEFGSAAALNIASSTMDTAYSSLGVRLNANRISLGGLKISPSLSVGWLHAFGDTASAATASFVAAPAASFTVSGVPIATDAALVRAGFDMQLTPASVFSLSYSGQYAASATVNGFNAALTLQF